MLPDEGTTSTAAAATQTTASGDAGAAATQGEQAIPYARFLSVTGKLSAAETRAASLESRAATLESELAAAKAQAGTAAAFQQQAAAATARYQSHFAIAKALGNFEPDVIEVVEQRYHSLPEAERANGIEPVLQGWKADPSKAPPSVRPHFTPPPAPAAVQGRAPVDPHKGVVGTSPASGGPPGAQELYAMSDADYIAYSNAERAKRGLPLHPVKS